VNCYPFIEAEKAGRRNVARACALLKVSRAAFCQHLAGPSRRDRADAELTEQIRDVHKESKGRYGSPRVHAELRRRGHRHSRKRVARLMRHAGIWGKTPKRWKKTTIPGPAAAARADQIQRDFTAGAGKINSRWCGSGSRREFHPPAPTEPCVIVSHYTALATLITRNCGTIASERTSPGIAA
jgi:hypothetical protein